MSGEESSSQNDSSEEEEGQDSEQEQSIESGEPAEAIPEQAEPVVEEERPPLIPEVILTREQISEGLTQLGRTADGLSHAFIRLQVSEKELTDVKPISTYRHLRFIDFSKNNLTSLQSLSTLENVIHLNVESNRIPSIDLGSSTHFLSFLLTNRNIFTKFKCFKEPNQDDTDTRIPDSSRFKLKL
jgi:hypothetical protein